MPTVNGKKYPYTKEGVQAAHEASYRSKVMPKYSNDPRTMQGRVLEDGGTVNTYMDMKCGGVAGDKFSKSSDYRRIKTSR